MPPNNGMRRRKDGIPHRNSNSAHLQIVSVLCVTYVRTAKAGFHAGDAQSSIPQYFKATKDRKKKRNKGDYRYKLRTRHLDELTPQYI